MLSSRWCLLHNLTGLVRAQGPFVKREAPVVKKKNELDPMFAWVLFYFKHMPFVFIVTSG